MMLYAFLILFNKCMSLSSLCINSSLSIVVPSLYYLKTTKVVGWNLYPERKDGVKTIDIIEFYDNYIKNKYENHLIIMDNAVISTESILPENYFVDKKI